MKKLLIFATLALALVLMVVSCGGGETTDETQAATDAVTKAETTVATGDVETDATTGEATTGDAATEAPAVNTEAPSVNTEAPAVNTEAPATEAPETEEPETEAPAPYIPKEDAAAGMVNHSFDTFKMNGDLYFEADGGSGDKLAAIDNTIPVALGEAHDSFTFRGWIGFAQPIKTFGYVIDGEIFAIEDYNSCLEATENTIKQLAGEHATRFAITIPTADLTTGEHTIGALMQLEDDTIVLFYEVTVVIEGLTIDETYPHHANIDWINYEPGMVVGVDTFSATGHSTLGAFTHTIDASVTELNILENATLTLGGWMGVDGGVNRYVYSVNGGEWMDAVGGRDGEPLPGHYEGSGFMDALKNGMFQSDASPASEIVADLSAYAGQTVDVAFAAVCEAEQLTIVPVITILSYAVPVLEIETEAPATEAPTEEPETEAPETEAPETEAPETEAPVVDDGSYVVDLYDVDFTGSYAEGGALGAAGVFPGSDPMCGGIHATAGDPTPALTADDTMLLLHYGTVSLGEMDLSKYSKVTITYATPADVADSDDYNAQYEATQKRIMLLNATPEVQANSFFDYLPAEDTIVASANYDISTEIGLLMTAEIDLTEVDYNGEVYFTFDFRNANNEFGATSYLIYLTGIKFE